MAVGTGSVLGSGDYYIQRDVGTQHPCTVQVRDGRIFFVDVQRKVVGSFGSRGAAFEFISYRKANTCFKEYLDGEIGTCELKAHIDPCNERYIVHKAGSNEAWVYSIKGNFWESRLCLGSGLLSGMNDKHKLYWTDANGCVWLAYDDNALHNNLMGKIKGSYWTIAVNIDPSSIKVFQQVTVNSCEKVDWVSGLVCDSGEDKPDQIMKQKELLPRNRQWVQNMLRSRENKGRKQKLRGSVALFTFCIDPVEGEDREVVVNDIVTSVRKAFA